MLAALLLVVVAQGLGRSPDLAEIRVRSADERLATGAGLKSCATCEQETLTEIRIHGNTLTPADEVLRLADVRSGIAFTPQLVEEVTARLRASKRFERVEVLKRFASIADPGQILLVIVVDEGPVRIERTGDRAQPTRVVRRRGTNLMVAPVLRAEDGYGVTYGARLTRPNVFGERSRLSFPLTWGGEKRAGIEADKDFARLKSGTTRTASGTTATSVVHVGVGASVSRRRHPFFREDEDRARIGVSVDRDIVRHVRVGGNAGWERASFMDTIDRFARVGAEAVVDTRLDQLLARNAVYAKVSWERLAFESRDAVRRSTVEGRGYVGLFGQTVLVVRGLREDSDKPLPAYLKPMLGGLANLRGFHAGTAIGDTLVAGSAELRVPLTSPLNLGKIGVSAFVDAATIYDKGERLKDRPFRQGFGGSVWLTAAVLQLGVTVAHGRGASTRVHVGGGVSF